MNRAEFEAVWRSSKNVGEVCKRLGVTESSAYYWARKFGLQMFCAPGDEYTPTEDEIAERTAEIRKSWSEEEKQRRVVGRARRRIEIPSYSSSHSTGSKWPIFV